MYSPVLQAGVSIVIENWDNIVADFCDSSCSALACVQMLGRCRTAKNIYINILDEATKLIMKEIQAKTVLDKYIADKLSNDAIKIATNAYDTSFAKTDNHLNKILRRRDQLDQFD